MGWSLGDLSWRTCLLRSGMPAVAMGILWTARDLIRRGPTQSIADLVEGDLGLFAIGWLAGALCLWVVSKAQPKQRSPSP